MSSQPVKRLSSLEIDEVSLVDRPANQHGLVTITKRDEGPGMAVYDEQGNEIDESRLESGDVVYDENGDAIQLFNDEDLQALLDEGYSAEQLGIEEDQLVGVGKNAATTAGRSFKDSVVRGARSLSDEVRTNPRISRGAKHVKDNKVAYASTVAAGTEENARGRWKNRGTKVTTSKSLGEQVLSDLSKALTDGDRDQVISKMADRVSAAEEVAKAAQEQAERLQEQAEFAQYVDIAKSFELPVDPEDLGGILQEVSKVLSNEQLETLERIFNTAAAAVSFDEAGSQGYSPTMDYVQGAALEMVGKSAGDISPEQATTALYSANDDAYLAYLSENQR